LLHFEMSLRNTRFAILPAAFLVFAGAPTVRADTIFGVGVSVSAIANDGCATQASYSTSGGLNGPDLTNFGAHSTEGFVNCANAFTGPSTPGLTSASLQTSAQDVSINDSFSHTGAARAASDLSTATLHGFSSSGGNPSFQGTGQGATDASLWDELTFSIPGAGPDTVTSIPVFFQVDGGGNDLTQQEYGAFLQFGTHGCFFACVTGVNWGWDLNEGGKVFNTSSGNITWASDPVTNSISWQTPTVNTLNNLEIEGILSLTGPTAVVDVAAGLWTLANGGTVDFGDTAGISFQAPAGVTMTSASGVFASATVPEPSALGLSAPVVVLLCIAERRRKKP